MIAFRCRFHQSVLVGVQLTMHVDQLATQGVGASVAIDIIRPKYISFSPWRIHWCMHWCGSVGSEIVVSYAGYHNVLIQYIPRNMHTVFALLCFVVVIHWLIFPYPSGLLHWHRGNLTIAPVPAKQPWWIWINTSCEFIMNDCITTTNQSTTKPCAYFLGYTVVLIESQNSRRPLLLTWFNLNFSMDKQSHSW